MKNEGPYEFDLESEKIKKPGKVILESYQFKKIPNFIDFLKNDLEINMVTAIDFTGSNLDPKLK